MHKTNIIILTLFISVLSACSIMPYNEKFACEDNADYGKCTNVNGAYRESITGEDAGPSIKKDNTSAVKSHAKSMIDDDEFWHDEPGSDEIQKQKTRIKQSADREQKTLSPRFSYQQEVYKKLKNIITETPAPMVKQATQVRTLILSYSVNREDIKELYMPRYVFYLLDESEWILGNYLNKKSGTTQVIFTEEE